MHLSLTLSALNLIYSKKAREFWKNVSESKIDWFKVHIFWEGHWSLKKILIFVAVTKSKKKKSGDCFSNFSDLLRIHIWILQFLTSKVAEKIWKFDLLQISLVDVIQYLIKPLLYFIQDSDFDTVWMLFLLKFRSL